MAHLALEVVAAASLVGEQHGVKRSAVVADEQHVLGRRVVGTFDPDQGLRHRRIGDRLDLGGRVGGNVDAGHEVSSPDD